MSRIVSVWLKAWPIARRMSVQASASRAESASGEAIDPRRPLVLVAPGVGGARIAALNRAAQKGGLAVGELLSNARSKVRGLQTRDADPAADAAALRKLALWCLRYTPLAAPWDEASGADGIFLDIAGSAHLFGGEAALLADLDRRLAGFGLVARLAVADTAGAAWAVSRHGRPDGLIVPPGKQACALRPLPLAALRLSDGTRSLLRRLGFKRIGELLDKARAPFAARFERELLLRLDQALGQAPEPLAGVAPPPLYRAAAGFLEPILSQEHVLEAATRLLERLAEDLARDAAGARTLRLLLFRVDGEARFLDIGLAAPSRDARHIARLIGLRLDRLGGILDAEFGFEAAAVHVLVAEPLSERQAGLAMGTAEPSPEALPQLIDRLQQRLGAAAVRSLRPHQSHIPERAVRAAAVRSLRPHQSHTPERAVRAASPSLRAHSPSPRASLPSPHTLSARGEGQGEGQRHTPTIPPPPRGGRMERHGLGSPITGFDANADRRAKPDGVPGGGDEMRRKTPPPGAPRSLSPAAECADRLAWTGLSDGAPPSPLVRAEAHASAQGEAERTAHSPAMWQESASAPRAPRPLLLLPRPEAAEVVALVPEGPPRQFRWRGVVHQVAEAQGPERIAPEWWRRTAERTRDYYVVEDTAGRRFWLYRAGLYGRGDDAPPAWFVHGVFG
jgi:protein ImuB